MDENMRTTRASTRARAQTPQQPSGQDEDIVKTPKNSAEVWELTRQIIGVTPTTFQRYRAMDEIKEAVIKTPKNGQDLLDQLDQMPDTPAVIFAAAEKVATLIDQWEVERARLKLEIKDLKAEVKRLETNEKGGEKRKATRLAATGAKQQGAMGNSGVHKGDVPLRRSTRTIAKTEKARKDGGEEGGCITVKQR
ncbi:hypothetical protein QBC46DRAFT_354410 [Diplogelasinospora grovesii]|uniref:Uncharacterized protein n=1 Tax=Diplogelasinospora grovesii TaxID=303347 RepID=A0AAN6N7A0_9PEZI|nr:hypothetical protein QBC46DRAFT_354410 [Diplogelasinospora grovesii]